MRDVAPTVVSGAVIRRGFHRVHDLADDFVLRAHLFAGNELALVVHIEQGTDVENRAEPTRGLGNSPPAHVKREIG